MWYMAIVAVILLLSLVVELSEAERVRARRELAIYSRTEGLPPDQLFE